MRNNSQLRSLALSATYINKGGQMVGLQRLDLLCGVIMDEVMPALLVLKFHKWVKLLIKYKCVLVTFRACLCVRNFILIQIRLGLI